MTQPRPATQRPDVSNKETPAVVFSHTALATDQPFPQPVGRRMAQFRPVPWDY